jgi:hypothetical protein
VQTFATPEPITTEIDVPAGDVRISATDGGTTVIAVRPSDPDSDQDVQAAEATRVEYANGHLLVRAPKPPWSSRSRRGVSVTIELPAGSHVQGRGQLADFHCDGRLGDCRIKTGLGQIRLDQTGTLSLKSGLGDVFVEHATGHAEITTGAGDVRVRELDASAVIKNSNGNTWVGVARGDVRLTAANGSIAVGLAEAGVVAKSANGDIRLGEVARGSIVLETRLGDLEVGIREGTAAWLDARSRAGSVLNALEASDAPGDATDAVEVRGRTTVGDIMIQRARGAVPRLPYVS